MQEMGVDHFLTKHYLMEVQKLLCQGWAVVGWHFGHIYWLDTVLQYTTWTLPVAPARIKPSVTVGPFSASASLAVIHAMTVDALTIVSSRIQSLDSYRIIGQSRVGML